MNKILALALSVAINVSVLVSLHRVGTPSLPHGEVYITEIPAAGPVVVQVKTTRWRRYYGV